MALMECPECKKQISDKALRCPQCGAPKVSIAPPGPKAFGPFKKPKKRIRSRIFLLLPLAIIIGASYWFWRASTSNRAAPPSAGFFAALRHPKKVVDERLELKEGQFVSYPFVLRTDARVEVEVIAQPKHVDVMLMTREEASKFRGISGRLSEGEFTYGQGLSSKQVHSMDKTEVLPKGEWTIIVFRPSEALLSREGTSVNIIVTVY
jgi:hypothetical protein